MDDVDLSLSALSRRQLLVGAVAVVLLLVLLVRHAGGGGGTPAPAVTPLRASAPAGPAAAKLLVIDVAGAVRRPGLYRLRDGSRIDDAIAAAGGVTGKAQLDAVNLAAPVADGERLSSPDAGRSLRRRALLPPARPRPRRSISTLRRPSSWRGYRESVP
jgi:SLBB domain-containing protein